MYPDVSTCSPKTTPNSSQPYPCPLDLAPRPKRPSKNNSCCSGSGHTPNDLLDQRDQLINQLSQQVQVTRLEQDDGSLNVFIGGGQSLLNLGRG